MAEQAAEKVIGVAQPLLGHAFSSAPCICSGGTYGMAEAVPFHNCANPCVFPQPVKPCSRHASSGRLLCDSLITSNIVDRRPNSRGWRLSSYGLGCRGF